MAKPNSITYGKRARIPVEEIHSQQCRICETVKDISEFGEWKNRQKLRRRTTCKSCRVVKRRALDQLHREEKGLCVGCGKLAPEHGKFSCRACLEECREVARRLKHKRLAAGLCYKCGQQPIEGQRRVNSAKGGQVKPECQACYLKSLSERTFGRRTMWQALERLFVEQNHQCPYTGTILRIGVNASLDHVLPYSRFPESIGKLGNLEWVRADVNFMKRDLTKEEFLALIEQIADRQKTN